LRSKKQFQLKYDNLNNFTPKGLPVTLQALTLGFGTKMTWASIYTSVSDQLKLHWGEHDKEITKSVFTYLEVNFKIAMSELLVKRTSQTAETEKSRQMPNINSTYYSRFGTRKFINWITRITQFMSHLIHLSNFGNKKQLISF